MNNKNYKWVVVGLLWFVCFFNYADRQAIFSVFIPIPKEMGLSDLQLSWVGAGGSGGHFGGDGTNRYDDRRICQQCRRWVWLNQMC